MSTSKCNNDTDCYDIQSCERTVTRHYDISVPVTVTPYATPEKPDVSCMSDITITCGHTPCDNPNNTFGFTVTQKIMVEIPIKFGAEVCYGKACADGECKCSASTGQ
jgi:hypothetical protein